MAKRSRIIYASQSVFVDGLQSNRIQTLTSNTTFTSEDIFELGQLDLIDVVDDVPAVAITMDHNNCNSIALLSKMANVGFPEGHLLIGASGYKGIAIGDFGATATEGVAIWAPVQDESKMGTLADNTIEQTMFMDNCFTNRLEIACTVGANATENYGLETDNKTWLLNQGRHVNYIEVSGGDFTELPDKGYEVIIASGINICGVSGVNSLSRGKIGFLFKNNNLQPCIRVKVNGQASDGGDVSEIPVTSGLWNDGANTTTALVYPKDGEPLNGVIILRLPSGIVDSYVCTPPGDADRFYMAFCADAYDTTVNAANMYFDENSASGQLGALRQGQIEPYIVDKGGSITSDPVWRLQGVTITADLRREPISQLGSLRPFDRPVTLPIPVTITVDSLASDLETFAMLAGKSTEFGNNTLRDIDIDTLLAKKTLNCIVYIYHQTDEEAAGAHASRTWKDDTTICDEDGTVYSYTAGAREYPQKVVVVKNIYPASEAYNVGMRANGTQGFTFNARTSLYVIDTRDVTADEWNVLENHITDITKA